VCCLCRGSCAAYGLVMVCVSEMFTVWTGGIYRSNFGVVSPIVTIRTHKGMENPQSSINS